jgi:predicted transcriptional regulator
LRFGYPSGYIDSEFLREVEDAMPLTRRQKQILDFLQSYILEHGFAPSFEEIAERMDRSCGAVRMLWLRALEAFKTQSEMSS